MLVTNTNDSGAGSLRDAIANAGPGDTIRFDASLANRTITLTSGEIFVNPGKNLTIDGGGAPNLIISGNNTSRIFRFGSNVDFRTNQVIRNLTLTRGQSSDRGGAIQTED
ncbi:MAG: calcium-binding protein, partial [Cyanobacteria bacterium Co-bin8]|nr:calcium-binding protein [Cyanobacteria bacterium Co-bin8]